MKLKLSAQALANIYPTGVGRKTRPERRTFVDTLNREVKEGELVEVSDPKEAARLVLSGLMESADPAGAKAIATEIEKQRAEHHAAAEKLQRELDADTDTPEDRRLEIERQIESCGGYCAAMDAALGKLGAKPKAAEKAAEEKG